MTQNEYTLNNHRTNDLIIYLLIFVKHLARIFAQLSVLKKKSTVEKTRFLYCSLFHLANILI